MKEYLDMDLVKIKLNFCECEEMISKTPHFFLNIWFNRKTKRCMHSTGGYFLGETPLALSIYLDFPQKGIFGALPMLDG
ncbi:MAG: hypothetical protein CM15mP22_4940 [Gammaproteobacteria bacterium]|nr:MAG: hypothetical protein CM15mP22_4940 [Gammaproteobacteria bacterium]